MRLSHIVPNCILEDVDNYQDFVTADIRLVRHKAYKAYLEKTEKPIVLNAIHGKNPKRILKVADAIGAVDVVLPCAMMDRDETVKRVLSVLEQNDAGYDPNRFKFIIVPQGKDLDDFHKCVDDLSIVIMTNAVKGVGIECRSIVKTVDPHDSSGAYDIRPSVVQRLKSSKIMNGKEIHIIEVDNRGGREIAEYRYVTQVTSVMTAAAYMTGSNGFQLGIPTKGRAAMSSMDFMIDSSWEFDPKAEVSEDDKALIVSNINVINGLR